jgi:Glyoxalase-like domain
MPEETFGRIRWHGQETVPQPEKALMDLGLGYRRVKTGEVRGAMDIELDHLFVCVSDGGGMEAERLAGLGLVEGEPNTHPGQGTACRRFVFANAYLELLWVCDPVEARAEAPQPLRLWDRWSGRLAGACPFGVGFRPSRAGSGEPPFPSWEYRPPYLPAPLCIHVEPGSMSAEVPLLFHLPFGRRPDTRPEPSRQSLRHPAGIREITRVLVHGPGDPAQETQAAARAGAVAFREGPVHLLEIGFDEEHAGLRADLRPLLPLVLLW